MKTLRKWGYELLEPTLSNEPAARAIELLLIVLIFLNINAIILESVHEINLEYHEFFASLETFSVIVFSIEYILRVWTSAENPRYKHSRYRYMTSGMAAIDLLSILPFYL